MCGSEQLAAFRFAILCNLARKIGATSHSISPNQIMRVTGDWTPIANRTVATMGRRFTCFFFVFVGQPARHRLA